jgi:hypothetical protein
MFKGALETAEGQEKLRKVQALMKIAQGIP